MAVGGLNYYSYLGGIAPDGTVNDGYITAEQMEAYNTSLGVVANMTYYDAAAYLEDQGNQAIDSMNDAISSFVEATLAIVTVLAVNDMAETAQSTGDVKDAQALQDFMGGNDVELTQGEIDSYNASLTDVESYAQDAAAYFAAGSNSEYVAELDASAENWNVSFLDASIAYDSANTILTVNFTNNTKMLMEVYFDMSSYLKTVEEILTAGEESNFYQTSPIVCGWDFSLCNEEA